MGQDLEYTDAIQDSLDELETEDARRIIKKLDDILEFLDHFLDRLKNHPGYRLRVGDFRVLVDTQCKRIPVSSGAGRAVRIVRPNRVATNRWISYVFGGFNQRQTV